MRHPASQMWLMTRVLKVLPTTADHLNPDMVNLQPITGTINYRLLAMAKLAFSGCTLIIFQ